MRKLFEAIREEYEDWNQFMLEQVSFQMGENTRIHGIAHCSRVLRLALMIAQAKGLSPEQKETLAAAAVFHDSRRCADGYDIGHGSRAADYYRDFCDFTGMRFDPLAAEIMAWHDRDTAEGVFEIELSLPEREDGPLLYKIFKDADGLDRVRLGRGALDVGRLRTPEARALVDYARALAGADRAE